MAAHTKKIARILPAGFSIFHEHPEYFRLLSGRQSPGKTRYGILPGMRYRALLLAIILVAGFLPAVSGAKDHQINAGAGYGGSIQPSGLVTVQSGDTPLFSITPAQGFRISSVVIDGSPVGAVPVYTFTPVCDDHMIYARFVRMTGSLHVASDPAGARVYLDDQFSGTIPDQGGFLIGDVPVGPHTLRFILAGYQTLQIDVTVDEGGQTVVPLVALTPAEPPATTAPTTVPTTTLTTIPTTAPTTAATTIPTTVPTTTPTMVATTIPTTASTTAPTTVPTTAPTTVATIIPTTAPTTAATTVPTTVTTTIPTTVPTTAPTTAATTIPTTTQTASPTPTPEPSPSSAGTGGVFVVSDPTATVVIQGKEWGRSNEVIENVPTGMQTITLSRQGYLSQTLMVNIRMGRVTVTPKVALELSGDAAKTQTPTTVGTPGPDSRYPANGALFIYTIPFGCSLSIDEIAGGMTPKLITSVPPGTHAVNITLPGYRISSRTVTVHPGDVSVVLVMMTPDFGSIGSAFS
jgi:hypothetical protein